MSQRPSPHALLAKLPAFALIALVVGPSCAIAPVSAQDHLRIGPDRSGHPAAPATKAAPPGRAKAKRPDPRYRPPANFAELQAVAGEVARTTGRKINWHLRHGTENGPLVRIRGTLENCTIYVHPVAARKVPPNTWAFLFGHEFAHLVEELGTHSATNPDNELKADIAGARYAKSAGYRLDAFLGWVLTEPNHQKHTATHGSLQQRVHAIAKRYGISQKAIQAEAQRASRYRATH